MPEVDARGRARKLPSSFGPFIMPLVLSALMSAIVSAVATAMSVGAGAAFVATWPGAWGASWIIAYPSLLIVLPLVRRIVAVLVEAPGSASTQLRPRSGSN